MGVMGIRQDLFRKSILAAARGEQAKGPMLGAGKPAGRLLLLTTVVAVDGGLGSGSSSGHGE